MRVTYSLPRSTFDGTEHATMDPTARRWARRHIDTEAIPPLCYERTEERSDKQQMRRARKRWGTSLPG